MAEVLQQFLSTGADASTIAVCIGLWRLDKRVTFLEFKTGVRRNG